MSTKITLQSPKSQDLIRAAWAVACRLRQFGYAEISSEASCSIKFATMVVRQWVAEGKVGLIDTARTGGRNRNFYEITPEGEIAIPMGGDAYQQMWTVMRKFGAFSPTDLVAHSAIEVSIKTASAYCQDLLAADYLRVTQKAKPPHKQAIYRLFKVTGVMAPRLRNVRSVIDPNTGGIVPLTGGQP